MSRCDAGETMKTGGRVVAQTDSLRHIFRGVLHVAWRRPETMKITKAM
jgi:hypothetical protein